MRCLSANHLEIQRLDGSRGLIAQTPSSSTSILCLLLKRIQDHCGNFLRVEEAIVDLEFQVLCEQVADFIPLIIAGGKEIKLSDEVHRYWKVNNPDHYRLAEGVVGELFWWNGEENGLYNFNFAFTEEEEDPPPDTGKIELPIPSSDIYEVDIFASLLGIDGVGFEDALALCDRASADWLKHFVRQLKEVRRDPEERMEEYKRKCLQTTMETWQAEDPDKYAELLGINNGSNNQT